MRLPHTVHPRIEIPEADVSKIQEFYRQGLYLQAYEHLRTLPPVMGWSGTAALVIAGRLANNLEAPKLARLLHARAWREDRKSAEAACHRAYGMIHSLGLLRSWRFVHRLPEFPDASPKARSELLALKAEMAATFRDFDRANAWLQEAERLDSLSGWICTSWAYFYRLSDAYDDALAAARRGLEQTPWYRPALQAMAEILTLLDRDDEAIALLREAMSHIESAAAAQQLASILIEKEQYEEARHWWKRSRELAPIMEAGHVSWWHGRMSDTQYFLGNIKEAAEHARQAGKGFHEKIARAWPTRLRRPAGCIGRCRLCGSIT